MSNSLQPGNNNSIRSGQNEYQFISNDLPFEQENNGTNTLSPERIIAILLRYKWLIMCFVIAGAAGAWYYADSMTPIYESSGTMLISSGNQSEDEISRIITQTTGYGTSSTLENELQVLQSRKFSREIAQELIAERGDSSSPSVFPVLWSYEEDGSAFKAGEETVASRIKRGMAFSRPAEESEVIAINFQSSSPTEAAIIVNKALEIYIQNSTRQNRQAAASTAEFLEREKQEIEQKLENSEEMLRQYMDNTGIVQVDEQANEMVNQRAALEVDLQRITIDLKTLEETIANYQGRLESIKPGLSEQFSKAVGPRIRNLQEELARYEGERMQIIAKNPNILEQETKPPRLRFVDDQIQSLKDEITNLSKQLFTENDEFVGMDGQASAQMVSEIQNRLIELQIERNQLLSRREALTEQKQEMDNDFNSLPKGMIELAKLERDVRINEELYMNVSRKYADMSIWKESQFGFGRVIDRGEEPGFPVSPNKKMLVLLGIMLGGLISVGFIVVKEYTDNSVKSVSMLKNRLPQLMFSAIPSISKIADKDKKIFSVGDGFIPEEMVILQDPTGIASESFRRLKNNIIYQNGIAPPKTIIVTSPEKGDGKSTVVANLGIAFAEEGYKTLLVGADFRRPKLQQYFGLSAKNGLSDYLSGDISFQEVLMLIQNTDLKDLKVITAGRETQSPEVIGNTKMLKHFLKKMEEVFDVVILDTPPFGIISDSTALLKYAESTLVVVRHRKTNSGMLLRTIEELGRIQANVRGVVLNDFDHEKEPYNSGYYQTVYGNYESYVRQ